MPDEKKTLYATRPFFWEGKNVAAGDAVKMSEIDGKWMLARGAVTEEKPAAKAKKK